MSEPRTKQTSNRSARRSETMHARRSRKAREIRAELERDPQYLTRGVSPEAFKYADAPKIVLLIGLVVLIAVTVVSNALSVDRSIALGIVLVVLFGASGLVCRGVGEIQGSRYWKAVGYYMGALAYIATAFVALSNGLPQLLSR